MKSILKIGIKVTSLFGSRVHPITGISVFHNGIDIAAPVGTPVHAPSPGQCLATYDHATGGRTLTARLDTNDEIRMAHLSEIFITAGQRFALGDIICATGNTGASTAPHLHLGIIRNGVYLDPLTVFSI